MTALDVLVTFLSAQFPFWGVCKVQYLPAQSALYIHCSSLTSRAFVIKDRFRLSALDIGLKRIIVTYPGETDFIIFLSGSGRSHKSNPQPTDPIPPSSLPSDQAPSDSVSSERLSELTEEED